MGTGRVSRGRHVRTRIRQCGLAVALTLSAVGTTPPSASADESADRWTAYGGVNHRSLGATVAAGDFNADGVQDVVASASGNDATDPVSLFVLYGGPYGGHGGPVRVYQLRDQRDLANGFEVTNATSSFVVTGDIGGEGSDDLVIQTPSEPGEPPGQMLRLVYGTSPVSYTLAVSATDSPSIALGQTDHSLRAGLADLDGSGTVGVITAGRTDAEVRALPSGASWLQVRSDPRHTDDDQQRLLAGEAGDTDGDGRSDVVLWDPGERSVGYVVRTPPGPQDSPSQLADLAMRGAGFEVHGLPVYGRSAGPAGDVNGDGLDDTVFSGSDGGGADDVSWVVFGTLGSQPVDVSVPGPWGFRISGAPLLPGPFGLEKRCDSDLGGEIDALGDVDGDGFGDLLVSNFSSARAYFLRGSTSTEPVVLEGTTARGFPVVGPWGYQLHNVAVVDVEGGVARLVSGQFNFTGPSSPVGNEGRVDLSTVDLRVPGDALPERVAPRRVDPGEATQRIFGLSAGDGSFGIARERFGECTAAYGVLARGDEVADALASAPLTAEGPLLLTDRYTSVDEHIRALAVFVPPGGTVYVLGGRAALGPETDDAIRAAGLVPQRLAGVTRVETAVAVAAEVRRRWPGRTQVALARAFGTPDNPTSAWADAVSGGAWAAATHTPLLLTPGETLHPAVAADLAAHPAERTVLLGGVAALSPAVESAVTGPLRVAGADRAGTAIAVADQLWPPNPGGYMIVNAYREDGWALGLPAAGVASDRSLPLLVSDTDDVPPSTLAAVSSCGSGPRVFLQIIGDRTVFPDPLVDLLDSVDGVPCG